MHMTMHIKEYVRRRNSKFRRHKVTKFMLLCVRLSVWLLVVVWVPVCAWLFACRAVWLQRLFAVLRCAVRCAMIARVGGRQVVIRKLQNCICKNGFLKNGILKYWIFQNWIFYFWKYFSKLDFQALKSKKNDSSVLDF